MIFRWFSYDFLQPLFFPRHLICNFKKMFQERWSGTSFWRVLQVFVHSKTQKSVGGFKIRQFGVPKTGVDRAKNTTTKNRLFGCLGFLMYLWGNYVILIIPKWLVEVPGHIAMLFRWFLELPKTDKKSTNYGPSYPVFITKIHEKYKKSYGNILDKYYLLLSGHLGNRNISKLWTPLYTYFDNVVSYFGTPPKQFSFPSVFDINLQWNIFETPVFLQNPRT